ncbi:MAG: hypothetical protein JRJ62_15195 [Deltaproteobacteria bacterium]|nr:hypothetical protein [Deltaproteobacteria bacterium]
MNIITIDADKAEEEIKKTILRDCTVPVPESAKDMAEKIRQIWKYYRSDCEAVYDADYAVRDKEIAALIQAYVEKQVAEKCKECADHRLIGDVVVDEMTQERIAELKAHIQDLKKYCAIKDKALHILYGAKLEKRFIGLTPDETNILEVAYGYKEIDEDVKNQKIDDFDWHPEYKLMANLKAENERLKNELDELDGLYVELWNSLNVPNSELWEKFKVIHKKVVKYRQALEDDDAN